MMTVTSTTASRRFSRRTTIAASVAALAVVGVGASVRERRRPRRRHRLRRHRRRFPRRPAGGVLAALEGAPIILLNKDSIPGPSSIELDRLNPRYIRILGGTGVVSANVATQLKAYATANTADEVTRIAGANRFATARRDLQARAGRGLQAARQPGQGRHRQPGAPDDDRRRIASTSVTLPDVCPGPDRGSSGPPPTATT